MLDRLVVGPEIRAHRGSRMLVGQRTHTVHANRPRPHLHECPLLLRGKAGHVHPRRRLALAQVIPLFLDGTK